MTSASLRIFAGLHAGAEIELSDGAWTIGSDDSCDIVLSDAGLEPRHAVIRIENGAASIEPLDGLATGASSEEAVEGPLPAGELFRLGPVLVAWAPTEGAAEAWRAIDASMQSAAAALEEGAEEKGARSETPKPAASEMRSDEAEGALAGSKAQTQSEAPRESASEKPGQGAAGWIALAAGILCCAALGGALAADGPRAKISSWLAERGADRAAAAVESIFGSAEEADEAARNRDALQKALEALGLEGAETALDDRGRCCVVTGWVKTDAERGAALSSARRLTVPVTLDLKVASDYTAGPDAALRAQGFSPAVIFEPAADPKSPDKLRISAYMADAGVEKAAFEKIGDAWPVDAFGRRLEADCRILHRTDVEALLEKHVPKALRAKLRAAFLPGEIRLKGGWSDAERSSLEEALEALRRDAGAPLAIALDDEREAAAALEAPAPARPAKAAAAAEPSPEPAAPNFRVAAVSGGAIPFITLDSGDKVFAGGTLPGGFTLAEIGHDKLVLSKDNRRINFPLRLSK